MTTAFAWFLATLITAPLLGWYGFYITTVKLTRDKGRAVRFASDWTTIFLIAAVYFIMYELWSRSFLAIILLLMISIAIAVTIFYWKIADELYIFKLFRAIWRLYFLVFLAGYLLLCSYGLISRIFV